MLESRPEFMRIFFHKSVDYIGPVGFLASFALLLGLLFGEALASEEAYAELSHAVALLSALGSAACVGCFAFSVFRSHDANPGLWTVAPLLSRSAVSDGGHGGGKDWPLSMKLLFGGVPILFAGLAGWVEARA